jgi:predicted O-methyltransferase YrrM
MWNLALKSLAFATDHAARERLSNKLAVWLDCGSEPSRIEEVVSASDLPHGVAQLLGTADESLLRRGSVARLEDGLARAQVQLRTRRTPFSHLHNGTSTLGRLCYAVCRALRPRLVVETGVAYGVTSAYILQALADNGDGMLRSIDLPPLARSGEGWVGHLVPSELRQRWKLYIGSARKILPGLLRESSPDVFIHDSLHTYAHMKWEIELVLPRLRGGGVLIADDIQGNRAFDEALASPLCQQWFAIRQAEKNAICGAIRIK